jgi:hypothetical protein
VALEQCDPNFLLKQAYLPAQGGLGDPETVSRFIQGANLGDADEIVQSSKIHRSISLSGAREGSARTLSGECQS